MIPQSANAIRERVRDLKFSYPYATDKELYIRYIDKYCVKLPSRILEKMIDTEIPSMDTVIRRSREIKEEERLQVNNLLIQWPRR